MSRLEVTRGYGLLEEFLAVQRSRLANRLISAAYKKGSVLDIGCGRFPFFLMNTAFPEKHGLDKFIQKNYLRLYKYHKINFVKHDMERTKTLPFDSNRFDVVTMLAVIEHLQQEILLEIFKEVHRLLKRGGLFVITTPTVCAAPLLRVMAKVRLVSPVEIREHKYPYSHARISQLLQEAGFLKDRLQMGHFFLNTWAMVKK